MEADFTAKIIMYTNKVHHIKCSPLITTGQLKKMIVEVDGDVKDFDFLFAGRMIKSNDKVVKDLIEN
jgi:hypothetical protein